MSILSDNLRFLRVQLDYSQEKLAVELLLTRPRWQRYEDGKSDPPLDILQRIARYFHISIDLLISVDLRKIPMGDLLKLGDNRILLPVTVDKQGEQFIEIIPHKARAGYLTGYADPEFIENLQQLSLPFLRNGKFRGFPVEGDSMPPHKDGSFIIGKYIERLGDVMDGKTYILLTKGQGIVYKRLNKNGKNALVLRSDNPFYEPYQVKASDVLEIWEYACSLETKPFLPEESAGSPLESMITELTKEVRALKENYARQ